MSPKLPHNVIAIAAILMMTAIALCFRIPNLSNRPFHGDEAVHAFKFRELWEHGVYHYDPNEFHGPTIYYAALPVVAVSGYRSFPETTERDFRLPVALIGALMVPMLLLLRRFFSISALCWSALLLAISPAFVFYSRYFIQEVPLACFTLGFIAMVWRFHQKPDKTSAIWSGLFAGLMLASKETAPLTFVAVGLGLLAVRGTRPQSDEEGLTTSQGNDLELLGLVIALTTAFVFLSGFFTDLSGPLGYFKSYTPWLKRAGGTDIHKHSFLYYFQTIGWWHADKGPIWSEALILVMAAFGAVKSFRDRQNVFGKFITVFSLSLCLIYSFIPYKTPWCVLSFLVGFIVLAGLGGDYLLSLLKPKWAKSVLCLVLIGFAVQLGFQSYRASFVLPADPANPYVYAQPVNDILKIKERMDSLSLIHPQHEKMIIKVVWNDNYYWPLPWYLRKFNNIGYYNAIPADADAAVVLTVQEFDEALTKKLDPTHIMTGFVGLRPGVFVETFVRMDLWELYIKEKKRKEAAQQVDDPRYQ